MIIIFIFRCADTEITGYYNDFADRPTRNNSPCCSYNKKLSCICLIKLLYKKIQLSVGISKFTARGQMVHYTFLYRIIASGVKKYSLLFLFQKSREHEKLILRK